MPFTLFLLPTVELTLLKDFSKPPFSLVTGTPYEKSPEMITLSSLRKASSMRWRNS